MIMRFAALLSVVYASGACACTTTVGMIASQVGSGAGAIVPPAQFLGYVLKGSGSVGGATDTGSLTRMGIVVAPGADQIV